MRFAEIISWSCVLNVKRINTLQLLRIVRLHGVYVITRFIFIVCCVKLKFVDVGISRWLNTRSVCPLDNGVCVYCLFLNIVELGFSKIRLICCNLSIISKI